MTTDGIARTPEQQAAWDNRPAWGSAEWMTEMQTAARRAFIYGHMGQGGIDRDRHHEIAVDDDYIVSKT